MKFLNDCCFKKDKNTKSVLLKGTFKDGLCQLQTPSESLGSCCSISSNLLPHSVVDCTTKDVKAHGCNNIGFQVNKIDVDMWHKRLGHPCEKIMRNVFKYLHLSGNFLEFAFCKHCNFGKHHQGHSPVHILKIGNLWSWYIVISGDQLLCCLGKDSSITLLC